MTSFIIPFLDVTVQECCPLFLTQYFVTKKIKIVK